MDWLPGSPDQAGPDRNAAADQLQLDVFGEVMDVLALARETMLGASDDAWAVQRGLMRHLSKSGPSPMKGIWEVRGGKQHFTYSKVMAWVAFDRAARAVERFGMLGRRRSSGPRPPTSTVRSASRRTTRSGTRSPRPSAARRWTPRCC